MKKRNLKYFVIASGLLVAFVLWTMAVCRIDVQQIGPRGSAVGLATVNRFVHDLTGVHMWLYILTDWLGLVPVGFGLCFAALGLAQWIRRKSIRKVDRSLLALGGFYIAVMVAYVYFEMEVINFRPVLIEGVLEASYPSSTTLLAMCVMPTAIMQFRERIRSRMLRGAVSAVVVLLTVFMVVGRLISGVHWFTDIVGGTLLSAGLVTMYHAVCAVR